MIVTDLDGTLLTDDGNILSHTLSILEKCKKAGIKIVIASTRSRLAAQDIIELIKPDYSILNDGAIILDKNNEIIYNELLSLEKLDEINNEYKKNINIEKMTAVKQICESQNISLSEVVAFGDNLNDIEMIKKCGIGIAMENAIHTIKMFAKGVCGNNNEDGVAKWTEGNIF